MSYALTHETRDTRVRWEHDEDYDTRGSYALDTEEETLAAEEEEIERLDSGEWVVLVAYVERKCRHCAAWSVVDTLNGIVISPDEIGSENLLSSLGLEVGE